MIFESSDEIETILGMDPSLTRFGWAILRSDRVIAQGEIIPEKDLQSQRIRFIYDEVAKIVRRFRPTLAGLEDTYAGLNRNVVMRLSEARAVAMLALAQSDTPLIIFKPTTLKATLAGKGNASKQNMVEAAKAQFGLENVTDNEADAIAAALCSIHVPEKGMKVS